jgi:hypothetical protein
MRILGVHVFNVGVLPVRSLKWVFPLDFFVLCRFRDNHFIILETISVCHGRRSKAEGRMSKAEGRWLSTFELFVQLVLNKLPDL